LIYIFCQADVLFTEPYKEKDGKKDRKRENVCVSALKGQWRKEGKPCATKSRVNNKKKKQHWSLGFMFFLFVCVFFVVNIYEA